MRGRGDEGKGRRGEGEVRGRGGKTRGRGHEGKERQGERKVKGKGDRGKWR